MYRKVIVKISSSHNLHRRESCLAKVIHIFIIFTRWSRPVFCSLIQFWKVTIHRIYFKHFMTRIIILSLYLVRYIFFPQKREASKGIHFQAGFGKYKLGFKAEKHKSGVGTEKHVLRYRAGN